MSDPNPAARGGPTSLAEALLMKEIGEHSWTPAQIDAAVKLLNGGTFEFAPGTRRVPPPLLADIKRTRLMLGMLKAVVKHSWWGAGIDEIVECSELGRKEFYNLLNNKEELFFPLLEFVVELLRDRIETAARRGDTWRQRLHLGIEEAVRFAVEEQVASHALLIESRSSGPEGVAIFDGLLEHFAAAIDHQVRTELDGDPPLLASDGVVGGIAWLLYARLAEGGVGEAGSLVDELTLFATGPYDSHLES